MEKDRIKNYNDHAKFLADIGLEIVKGNAGILNINGVKEIIGLYLLIPYITNATLDTPDEACVIPHLQGQFIGNISLEDLRNTISHSFVTVEQFKDDGTQHGKYLIFDDRIITDKATHSKKGKHGSCYSIMIDQINRRLNELYNEIINSQN